MQHACPPTDIFRVIPTLGCASFMIRRHMTQLHPPACPDADLIPEAQLHGKRRMLATLPKGEAELVGNRVRTGLHSDAGACRLSYNLKAECSFYAAVDAHDGLRVRCRAPSTPTVVGITCSGVDMMFEM